MDYTSKLKNVIMETESGSGGLTYRYTYGLDKVSAGITGDLSGAGNLNQNGLLKLYYHHDKQGSTDFLTDNVSGKVTSYTEYDPWGALTMKTKLKMGVRELDLVTEYTGHPYDQVLGVYYARARMYDASDRRFMAVDPVGGQITNPQTLTQYYYCLNNPAKYTDPTGRWQEGDENRNAEDKAAIAAATAEYYAATDKAGRDAAHEKAEYVRNNPSKSSGGDSGGSGDYDDYPPYYGEILTALLKLTATLNPDGKVYYTAESWERALRLASEPNNLPNIYYAEVAMATGRNDGGVTYATRMEYPGFNWDPFQKIYYSPSTAWQRYFGFNDTYDVIFDLFCNTTYEKHEFESGGADWRIEFWRGNYWQMGVGAEIGVYNKQTDGKTSHYSSVGEDDYALMGFKLYDTTSKTPDTPIFTREPEEHWWLNGFKPGTYVDSKDLKMVGEITLNNQDMFDKLYDSLSKSDNFTITERKASTPPSVYTINDFKVIPADIEQQLKDYYRGNRDLTIEFEWNRTSK